MSIDKPGENGIVIRKSMSAIIAITVPHKNNTQFPPKRTDILLAFGWLGSRVRQL